MTRTDIDRFCPAKWQDIRWNPCAKSIKACNRSLEEIYTDIDHLKSILDSQRQNLLNNIADKSCIYCWKVEAQGKESLRYRKKKYWNGLFTPRLLEVSIGNLCNFSCAYCSARFSSQWQNDMMSNGNYNILVDVEHYVPSIPLEEINLEEVSKIYNMFAPTDELVIVGGETLISPITEKIIEQILDPELTLQIVTNLCPPNKKILNNVIKSVNNLKLVASLDSGNPTVAEFMRHGLDFKKFTENLHYVLNTAKHAKIGISTVCTSSSIFYMESLAEFIKTMRSEYPDQEIEWYMLNCVNPRIQGFEAISPMFYDVAYDQLRRCQKIFKDDKRTCERLELLITCLNTTEYSKLIHTDMQNFFQQYAKRRNIVVPDEIMKYYE